MNIKIFQNGQYVIENCGKESEKSYGKHGDLDLDLELKRCVENFETTQSPEDEDEPKPGQNQAKCIYPERKWRRIRLGAGCCLEFPFTFFSYLEVLIPLMLIHPQLMTDFFTEDMYELFQGSWNPVTFLWIYVILSYEWTKASAVFQLVRIHQGGKGLGVFLGFKSIQIAVEGSLLTLTFLGYFTLPNCQMAVLECKHTRSLLVLVSIHLVSLITGMFHARCSGVCRALKNPSGPMDDNNNNGDGSNRATALSAGPYLHIFSYLDIWLALLVLGSIVVNWENFCLFWDATRPYSPTIPAIYTVYIFVKIAVAGAQLWMWKAKYNYGGSLKGLIACIWFHITSFGLGLVFFIFCLVYWNDKVGYEENMILTPPVQFGLLPLEILVMTQVFACLSAAVFCVQVRKFKFPRAPNV